MILPAQRKRAVAYYYAMFVCNHYESRQKM
jgi:hypothetical protein